ncbi:hypothetical protein C8R43DRAFT_946971 [Mycena crocata]|nr:hypothetical protein C8R43DRAFT_946971 [Mycena crocata]
MFFKCFTINHHDMGLVSTITETRTSTFVSARDSDRQKLLSPGTVYASPSQSGRRGVTKLPEFACMLRRIRTAWYGAGRYGGEGGGGRVPSDMVAKGMAADSDECRAELESVPTQPLIKLLYRVSDLRRNVKTECDQLLWFLLSSVSYLSQQPGSPHSTTLAQLLACTKKTTPCAATWDAGRWERQS